MISVRDLKYSVGDFNLSASLEISGNEYFVLFGTTGCGKTSLVECICGLRAISSGRIVIGGKDVTEADPRSRRVGYVPQDGALFYHLTVRQNIAFNLTVKGVSRDNKDKEVKRISAKLGIEHLLDRRIPGLSGGERQRVALARALVCAPKVLLLDEPVSALDEFTRETVCKELVDIQKETSIPAIHICHSFEESRSVADRIGVMRDGKIIQIDTPDGLITRPLNAYVARLLRLENIFSVQGYIKGNETYVKIGDTSIKTVGQDEKVDFMIRPWEISIAETDEETHGDIALDGTVSDISLMSSIAKVRIDGPLPVVAHIPRSIAKERSINAGDSIRLSFPVDAVHILRKD